MTFDEQISRMEYGNALNRLVRVAKAMDARRVKNGLDPAVFATVQEFIIPAKNMNVALQRINLLLSIVDYVWKSLDFKIDDLEEKR